MAHVAGEDGDKAVPSFAHFLLGLHWRWSGQPGRALEHFCWALEALGELELVPNLSSVLLQVARLLAASDPTRAARLAGAGLAFADRAGLRFPPRFRRGADLLLEELRSRLGPEEADHAWAEGCQLATNEAIALALAPSGRRARSSSVSA